MMSFGGKLIFCVAGIPVPCSSCHVNNGSSVRNILQSNAKCKSRYTNASRRTLSRSPCSRCWIGKVESWLLWSWSGWIEAGSLILLVRHNCPSVFVILAGDQSVAELDGAMSNNKKGDSLRVDKVKPFQFGKVRAKHMCHATASLTTYSP